MRDSKLKSLDYEISILHRRASFNRKFADLDRSAYLLLYQMSVLGKIGVKALADEFRLDVSTISRQTTALEDKGYVTRTPDPDDGRASYFELTELGKRKLEEAQAYRLSRFKQVFKDWAEEDLDKFRQYLEIVNRTYID